MAILLVENEEHSFIHFPCVDHEKETMMSIADEIETPSGGNGSSDGSDGVSSISDGSIVFSESFGKELEKAVALCTMKGLLGKCTCFGLLRLPRFRIRNEKSKPDSSCFAILFCDDARIQPSECRCQPIGCCF